VPGGLQLENEFDFLRISALKVSISGIFFFVDFVHTGQFQERLWLNPAPSCGNKNLKMVFIAKRRYEIPI